MPEIFDPYFKWLGIPPEQQPPNHYQLLGVPLFVDDPDVIETSAERQMLLLRSKQTGKYSDSSQKLLNEISIAKVCLLNADKKKTYDAELRATLDADKPKAKPAAKPAPKAATTETIKFKPQEPTRSIAAQQKKPAWQHPAVLGGFAAIGLLLLVVIAVIASRNGTTPPVAQSVGQASSQKPIQENTDTPSVDPSKPTANTTHETKLTDSPVDAEPLKPEQPIDAAPAPAVTETKTTSPDQASPPQQSTQETQSQAMKVVYLDDLSETDFGGAYDSIGKHGLVGHSDQKYPGFKVSREQTDHSLSLHARRNDPAFVTYDLTRDYQDFRATVAIAETLPLAGSETPLTFKVIGDGELLWQSGPLQRRGDEQDCAVSISGIRTLRLEVDCPGSAVGAWAVWLNPQLTAPQQTAAELATSKAAVPDAEALEQAQATVKELFNDAIATAKTTDEKQKLANTLLKQGMEISDDPAARYVLFRLAGSVAVAAGDAETALAAIEAMAGSYDVDAWKMRLAVLRKVSTAVRGKDFKEKARQLAKTTLPLVDIALAEGGYEVAGQLADIALQAARKTKDPDLIKRFAAREGDVEQIVAGYKKTKDALDTLKENPDDPEANLIAGRFFCFSKGDWQKGLPMLEAGSDASLQALAKLDLATPGDAEKQVQLADQWWDSASSHAAFKKQIQLRAAHWYQQALPDITRKLIRTKIERRLSALDYKPRNHALWFDGKSSYVALPTPKYAGDTITVEAWVKLDSYAKGTIFFNSHPHFLKLELTKETWRFWRGIPGPGGSGAVSVAKAVVGENVHLAGVWDGTNVRLFVQGRQVRGRAGLRVGENYRRCATALGAEVQSGPTPVFVLHGTLDEVRISSVARYDSPFTPQQRFETDNQTLALYHFDEGSGDIAHDSSGNRYHGTIHDAKWVSAEDAVISEAVRPAAAKEVTPLGYELKKHPSDALQFAGHWYKVVPGNMTWEEAREQCKSLGGYLACIETDAEAKFLAQTANRRALWLGGFKDSQGTWRWMNGRPFDFTFWYARQPDNALGREDRLGTAPSGQWNDAPGDFKSNRGFICEWEL